MNLKTFSTHLLELNKKVITKNEINAISKFLNSLRFLKNEDHFKISQGQMLLDIISSKSYKLEKWQNDFGKQWLKDYYLTKKGELRKRAKDDFHFSRIIEDDLKEILNNVTSFRFLGYAGQWDSYSRIYTYFIPVYEVHTKNGPQFTYSPVHMGKPLINPEICELLEG